MDSTAKGVIEQWLRDNTPEANCLRCGDVNYEVADDLDLSVPSLPQVKTVCRKCGSVWAYSAAKVGLPLPPDPPA